MFQQGSGFTKFLEFCITKKAIGAILKYIGGYIRKAGTRRWGKLFYRPKMLCNGNVGFGIGSSKLLAQSIDYTC